MNILMINRTFNLKFYHQLLSQIVRRLLLLICFLLLLLLSLHVCSSKNNWFFRQTLGALNSTSPERRNRENVCACVLSIGPAHTQREKEWTRVLHTINLFPVFSFYFRPRSVAEVCVCVCALGFIVCIRIRVLCLCLHVIFPHNLQIGQTKTFSLACLLTPCRCLCSDGRTKHDDPCSLNRSQTW